MTLKLASLWVSRAQRAVALCKELARLTLVRPPRRHPGRIGLIVLVDLVQDAELILPAALAARRHGGFEVRVIMTDWLDRVAPTVPSRFKEAGFAPIRLTRDAVLTGVGPSLADWDALLTASESTALAHRVGHALAKRAKAAGLATFTMQHGLENIGLTYQGDGEHDFASDWILTWGDPAGLPVWVADSVRSRCIGVGRVSDPDAARRAPRMPPGGRTVAVFENLHWERYDDVYRTRFLADLRAAAEARPELTFVVRPHPAGRYLATHPDALPEPPTNLILADQADPDWAEIAAADLIAAAAAVVTTPSTIALDAAGLDRPVAVAGYGLDLAAYAPLPQLSEAADWLSFIDAASARGAGDTLRAFRRKHLLEGDACASALEAIAARIASRAGLRRLSPSVRAAQKIARALKPAFLRTPFSSSPAGAGLAATRAEYQRWLAAYDAVSTADRERIRARCAAWGKAPLVSVVVDARRASYDEAAQTIESIQRQLMPQREVIVCGGAASRARGAASDLNAALDAAQGRFAVLIEAGDVIARHALFALADAMLARSDALWAYSDEDVSDERGRRSSPSFKPDWSRDLFLGRDYACRLALFDLKAARAARCANLEPRAALYDLLLRMSSAAPERPVLHVPFVLHHRSAALALSETAEQQMIASARGLAGEGVTAVERVGYGLRRVHRALPEPAPLVSLIVPTRDRLPLLRRCVEGLRRETAYPAIEILVVDNQSSEPETLAFLDEIEADPSVRVLPDPRDFNFARINNMAARHATGALIGLINNDIAVIEPGWLREMAGLALREDVGAVGAMLLYPDHSVQHAGCVLGVGGVASHIHNGLDGRAPGYDSRLLVESEVSAVTAACLLSRRSVWDAVGGLDEGLPVAYNDVDYCLRLREAGLKVLWTPFARLEHHESASRGQDNGGARRGRLERDKAFMRTRWGARLQNDPFYNPNLTLSGTNCGLAHPPRAIPPWRNL